jgi:hypothetical protein
MGYLANGMRRIKVMGIFTTEALNGFAWIIAGTWGVVTLIKAYLDHLENSGWKRNDEAVNAKYKALRELEEVKKERDMMMAHFFPEKEEVPTEAAAPVKKKRGRPRKYK